MAARLFRRLDVTVLELPDAKHVRGQVSLKGLSLSRARPVLKGLLALAESGAEKHDV